MSIDELIARAFKQGPASAANQLIHDARQQVTAEQGQAVSYEVPLMGRPFGYLQQEVAPRLAMFMHHKRVRPEETVVSLFVGDLLCFVRADQFLDVVRESLGLAPQVFAEVLRRWRRTGTSSAGGLPPG